MTKATIRANFKKAASKAKKLYKTGRYKKFSDAMKAAFKTIKKGKRVGATKLIERGERHSAKPKRIVRVNRTKKGTFKKFQTVGSTANYNEMILRNLNSKNSELRTAENALMNVKKQARDTKDKVAKRFFRSKIKDYSRYRQTLKREITMLKALLK